MNIREWFGFNGEYNMALDINSCIDGLLELYAKAIKHYFSVHDAENYHEILIINQEKLDSSQKLFLNWLKEEGFPYLSSLAKESLPNNENLISKIEYDKYILEEEMDFQFPEDVRSILISIVNDVPDYIQDITETAVSNEYEDRWSSRIVSQSWRELETILSVTTSYRSKEFDYPIANFKESATKAGSLFI